MAAHSLPLLGRRRFGPIFATQFMGAFNDNLYRSAMLFSLSFGIASGGAADAALLAALAGGVFILPYFLFSGLSGQVADRMDKAALARMIKGAEVLIMLVGALGLVLQSIPILMLGLFAMGAHSTFFGPIKYSILPQHLAGDELLAGTGMVEAGTFLAILLGQIAGGLIDHHAAAAAVVAVALVGLGASMFIPPAPAAAPQGRLDRNPLTSTLAILRHAVRTPALFKASLGITWFFALGGVLTQEMVPLARAIGSGPSVAVLFLALFSVGIAVGSVAVSRLQKGVVSARFVPVSAFVLALAVLDLSFATSGHVAGSATIGGFLSQPAAWRIVADIVAGAIAGGIYVVPLYAILQTVGEKATRSRDIAANNVINAVGMVAMAGVAAWLASVDAPISDVFLFLGVAGLGVSAYACVLLPDTVIKSALKTALRIAYRVELAGAENMPRPGDRAVVVVNHVSFLDAALLAAFLPGRPTFAVATKVAEAWWMRPLLRLFDAFPVDPTNPMSTKAMVKAVREGRTLVIFPEGRITVTGSLMKIFDGPGMVAEKADAPIIPIRIDGAQYTPFSRLRGKVRLRWFPKVSITVLPPRRFATADGLSARERRAEAGRRLYDVMSGMMFETSMHDQTLHQALIETRRIHGASTIVLEDVKRQPMTIGRLLAASAALGRAMEPDTRAGEAVGLLLPNVSAVAVAFFALQRTGRVPTMLNHSAGAASLRSACRTALVRRVLTSRAFVEQAGLADAVEGMRAMDPPVSFSYIEDVAGGIGRMDRIRAALLSRFDSGRRPKNGPSPDSPACILFTSGSEGSPKAVLLSHRNLLANCRQIGSRIDFSPSDVVLNALPVFHSFGLTGGMLLPVLNGIRTMLYPNPLHYRIVPAVAYDVNATIMFGTDTFLAGYARMASPYDFHAMRYVFAGAERVREETRRTWNDRFGVRILEGYGATEAGPVIAVNTPMHFRAGTVGRTLPGVETRLVEIPGIMEGERLSVRGPNVMIGHYMPDAPGVLVPPPGGWHDLGDIVSIDGEGFVTIRGRARRFAKIAGEMVSLPSVEENAAGVWPGFDHAVVTIPDPRKGERLILFTTAPGATPRQFQEWARANGVTELFVPKEVVHMEALPLLGTGKTDLVSIQRVAESRTSPPIADDDEED